MTGSAIVAVYLFVFLTTAFAADGESTLFTNGRIWTGTRAGAIDAAWFVVKDGRFVATGTRSPAASLKPKRVVDLGGRFVAPGFIDAHVHLVDGGLSLLQTDLGEVRTRDELAKAVARARANPLGDWVLARNLGLAPFDGRSPTHADLDALLGAAPAFIALQGGHHFYVNRAAARRLGVSAASTGVLVDEAGWTALRKVYATFPPELVAKALGEAERRALSYGVTTVGDNTFFPDHMAQMLRMAKAGAFRLRVLSRSFGAVPTTRFLMSPMGKSFAGRANPQIEYFGEKHFVDSSLSPAEMRQGGAVRVPGGSPKLTVDELRDVFLFAGRTGTAFHTQGREGARRLIAARESVRARRSATKPDVIDHCGSCGGGDLPARIRDAGFRVVLLAPQLHDLPLIYEAFPEARARETLAFRAIVEAGLEPAFHSDWPHGNTTTYTDLPDSFHRIGFSPLATLATVVSGKTPAGTPIPYAASRTVSMLAAFKGATTNAAAAIGRAHDLGEIAPGKFADFVVLPVSPFDVDPVLLYRADVDETYISGERVYQRAGFRAATGAEAREDVSRFSSRPWGMTPSPVIGYDPTPGFILGGALFFYQYSERGVQGDFIFMTTPEQYGTRFTAQSELNLSYRNLWPGVTPSVKLKFDNWLGRYYGFGQSTKASGPLTTNPTMFEARIGVSFALGGNVSLSAHGVFVAFRDPSFAQSPPPAETLIEGAYAGARLELAFDTRDFTFSTRRGGRYSLWVEPWFLQAGDPTPRLRVGVRLHHFVPLYAPNFILALRVEGGASIGERAYVTNFTLGGIDVLRGYLSNRFRGDHFALGSAELRFPLWSFISGVAFAESGRVWRTDALETGLAVSGGGGLRFALPPDQLIKLRFDAGFSADQWGIFFSFNEAF